MPKFSARNKIIVACVLWLGITAAMFMYAFSMFDSSNALLMDGIATQKGELRTLQAEQDSYKKAKQDLEALTREPLQPQDFFNKDITLVNEIRTLENLSGQMNVKLVLSGISGTIKSASAAKTKTSVAVIPYSLSVTGKLADVVRFMDSLEHLSFITNIGSVNISTGAEGQVTAHLTAAFYLQK